MATTELAMTEVSPTKSLFLPATMEEPEINSINFRQSLRFFQEQLVINGTSFPSPKARLNSCEGSAKNGLHFIAQNKEENIDINKNEIFNGELPTLSNCKIQIPTVDTILESVRVLRAIQKSQEGRSAIWTLDTTSGSDSDQESEQIDAINNLNITKYSYSLEEPLLNSNDTSSSVLDEKARSSTNTDASIRDNNKSMISNFDSDQMMMTFSSSTRKTCSFWPSNTIAREKIMNNQYEEEKNKKCHHNELSCKKSKLKNCQIDIANETEVLENNFERQQCFAKNIFKGCMLENPNEIINTNESDGFKIHNLSEENLKAQYIIAYVTEPSSPNPNCTDMQNGRSSPKVFLSSPSTEEHTMKKLDSIDGDSGIGTQRSISSLSPTAQPRMRKDSWSDTCSSLYVSAECSPCPSLTSVFDSIGFNSYLSIPVTDSLDTEYTGDSSENIWEEDLPCTSAEIKNHTKDLDTTSYSPTCINREDRIKTIQQEYDANISNIGNLHDMLDSLKLHEQNEYNAILTKINQKEKSSYESHDVSDVNPYETKNPTKDLITALYLTNNNREGDCANSTLQENDVNSKNGARNSPNSLDALNLHEQNVYSAISNDSKNSQNMQISNASQNLSDPNIISNNGERIPHQTEIETSDGSLILSEEATIISSEEKNDVKTHEISLAVVSQANGNTSSNMEITQTVNDSEFSESSNVSQDRRKSLDSTESVSCEEKLLNPNYQPELQNSGSDIFNSENLEDSFTSFTSIDLISSSPDSQKLEEKLETNCKDGNSLGNAITSDVECLGDNLQHGAERNTNCTLNETSKSEELVEERDAEIIVNHKKITTSSWNLVSVTEKLYAMPEYPTENASEEKIFEKDVFILSKGAFSMLPEGIYHLSFESSSLNITSLEESQKVLSLTVIYGKVKIIEKNVLMIDNKMGRCLYIRCDTPEELMKLRDEIEVQCSQHWQFDCFGLVKYPLKSHENVVIIDLGSCSTRAGILMDQPSLPQLFFPTICATDKVTGHCVYGMEALQPEVRQNSILSFPVRPSAKINKNAVDTDLLGGLFRKIFNDLLIDPNEYTVQVCLPRNIPMCDRRAVVKLLLEDLKVKAVTLTTEAILTLYAHNVDTAVIVDIGDRMDIIPVVDGFIVENGVTRLPYGGQRIIHHMKHALAEKHISLSSEADSYVVQYITENLAYIAEDFDFETQTAVTSPNTVKKSLALQPFAHDETVMQEITLEDARFKIPEGIFKPELWGLDIPGVHQLVQKAIQATSVDVRKKVAENIYVSGGVTLLPGFVERLNKEVAKLSKAKVIPKVHASNYRYHCTYIGACKFARMKEFQQVCLNLKDFKEQADCLKKFSLCF